MKMELDIFREKLLFEIEEFRKSLDSTVPQYYHKIQVHGFCIAALLRKILESATDYGLKEIDIYEKYRDGSSNNTKISLKDLLNNTIHYNSFRQVLSAFQPSSTFKYFEIISDHESQNIYERKIKIEDFINMAEDIAVNDTVILKPLMAYGMSVLKGDMNCTDLNRLSHKFFNLDTHWTLHYVFELIGRIDNITIPNKSISIYFDFYEIKEHKKVVESNGNDVIKLEKVKVSYSEIINKLSMRKFVVMCGRIKGDRYMDTHDGKYEAALKGEKIIPLFMVQPEDFNIKVDTHQGARSYLIASEMMDMLKSIRDQL